MVLRQLFEQETDEHVQLEEMVELLFGRRLREQPQNLRHDHAAFVTVFFGGDGHDFGQKTDDHA